MYFSSIYQSSLHHTTIKYIHWSKLFLGSICALTLILSQEMTVSAIDHLVLQPNVYGVSIPIGQAQEPCSTEANTSDAVILSATDAWQSRISSAKAGETLLFREGTYQATAQVRIPEGKENRPITLKPYNCEAVTLYASLRPLSYNVIAGLRIETQGLSDDKWVIRVDGKNMGKIKNVLIRYNTILGGHIDAIRILDDSSYISITGNYIDGGSNGHNIFVTSEEQINLPDQIEITQNRLSKSYFDTPAEDMFQVRDVGNVLFEHNTCTDGMNMEECIDIKSTVEPLSIKYNLFEGAYLQQIGKGEDGASGCMVIHETDGHPENHLIAQNFFDHCKEASVRFATGESGNVSRATLYGNLIVQSSSEEGKMPVWQAQNVSLLYNTIVYGHLQLGDSAQDKMPTETVITNNIFYKTRIDDFSSPPESTYLCTQNLLYQTSGTGFVQTPCSNSLEDNPLFVDPDTNNFHLQAKTPARALGDAGMVLGAYPFDFAAFTNELYIPNVVQND